MSTRKLFKWKRVAIDFDGTLVESVGHTKHNTDWYFENDIPLISMKGASETTAWLREQGFEILIYTCRPDYQRKYMEKILDRELISYDYILFYTKPLVDLYIDDKGFRFTDWSTTQTWLEQHLEAPFNSPASIGMEPQGDFEDLLRAEKARWTLTGDEQRVLDVGCGSGRLWNVCEKNLIPEVLIGIEPDIELAKIARQGNFYTVHHENVFSKTLFDAVTLFGVLEHVDDPLSLLEEYAGIDEIVATVPNANSFHRLIGVQAGMINTIDQLGPQDIEIGHKRVFSYYEFHALMSMFANDNGYRIKLFGSCGFKFTNSTEMMQFADRWDAINKSAEIRGLVGSYSNAGAELYCRLEKR